MALKRSTPIKKKSGVGKKPYGKSLGSIGARSNE
jgi:hypothetical protein